MALTSLYVFFGGGLGAVCRFLFTKLSLGLFKSSLWGTLFVNVLGAILLYYFSEKFQISKKEIESGVKIGFLGGLTTFSTLSYETYSLIQSQKTMMAMGHLGLNIIFGIVVLVLVFR